MELLEKHFDIAFAAPDGIKRLRELILTLAMQGKLVPQDPSDQPASALLKEIEVEKKRLVKTGKIKAEPGEAGKHAKEIKAEEVPYALPQGWEWVRLSDVSTKIHYGYTASANHSLRNIRLLRITDIQDNKVDWDSVPGCDAQEANVTQYLLTNNDILIARTGGTVGKSYLVQGINVSAVFASYLIRVIPSIHLDVRYLKYFAEGPLYWKQLYAACSGTGQPNVNGTSLSALRLPLPPLAEQRRIVARIHQLMARCDELEKLRAEREQKRIDMHNAALNRLLTAQETDSFTDACQFITRHFGEFYSVKENVAELRKAILQLAVMGKLVPQDPADQSASELLEKIDAEKSRLVKAGKIKAPKPLPEIKPEKAPYALPKGWKWVFLQDLFALVTDGDHQPPPKSDSGIPFLVIGNLNTGNISFSGCRFVPQNYYQALDWGRKPKFNDILYTVTGSLGIPIRVNTDCDFCVQRHVAILKAVYSSPVDYLIHVLSADYAFNYATSVATGIAQKTVPLSSLRTLPVAVPPANEQFRIVEKINQFNDLCDELEQQINDASSKQTELLYAVMAQS